MSFVKTFNTLIKSARQKTAPQESGKELKKKKPRMKPSALGGECLRKLYYDFNRVEEDREFPLPSTRICKLGDYISDMYNDYFRDAGILIDYVKPDGTFQKMFGEDNLEFPVTFPELSIKKAYIDAVAILDSRLVLGEWKSINLRGYTGLKSPRKSHLIQASIYLVLFNKMLSEGAYSHIDALAPFEKAEEIVIVYYCKDNSNHKEFVINNETALKVFEQIIPKILYIKDMTEKKELPGTTPEFCNSCSWNKKCAQNFNI